MANRWYNQFTYSLHKMPVEIDCNFTVASTGTNGISGLVGPGVANVFMKTSGTQNGPVNPAAGIILIQLQDSYYRLYAADANISSPVTGSAISISSAAVLTVGVPYVITSVGTSTAANWQAVGLPANVTPAVGVAFLASVTGSGTGTGQVKAIGPSGIGSIELVGNGNLMLVAPVSASYTINNSPYLIFQCLAPTNSTTTTSIATAPVDGSLISMCLYLSNSSVLVQGE